MAQEDKSLYIVGGQLSFANNTLDYENSNSSQIIDQSSGNFNISPYIGRKLSENSIIAIGPSYYYSKYSSIRSFATTNDQFLKRSGHGLGLRLFYRHILKEVKRLSFFVQPTCEISYTFGKEERAAPLLVENKSLRYSASLGFGGAIKVNPKWQLILSNSMFSFSHLQSRTAGDTNSRKSASLSFNPSLTDFRFGIERLF